MPSTRTNLDGKAVDLAGRRIPARFNIVALLQSVGGLSLFQTQVPASYWQIVGRTCQMKCPCNESPTIEAGKMTECKCGRFYLFTGTQLRVSKPDAPDQIVD